jgi:uncharacterized protein (TIGR00369 family)
MRSEQENYSGRLTAWMREVSTEADLAAGLPVVETEAPLVRAALDHDGAYRLGPLASVVDGAGGLSAGLAVLPDWVVTSELTLRLVAPARVGPLHSTGRVLRRGRTLVVADVTVVDRGADDLVVATGIVSSSALTPAGGPPGYARPVVLDNPRPPVADTDHATVAGWAGVRPRAGGGVEVTMGPLVLNPWGILHGGVTALLVDEAAVAAVSGRTGRPAVATSMALAFLAPARVGPIAAVGHVLGTVEGQEVTVRVEIRDTGSDDRLVAAAIATVRP